MGSVWAAVHETLGREVAVKFLQPQDAGNPVLTDRFVSEAHMVASIKHRFVVDVFDFGVTEDGLHYIVLELLHGRSLADRMDRGPALTVRQAVRLMADCLRGLHVVHEAGIVHRDLKPDNIIVVDDADGVFPKLIDFGISRRADSAVKLNPLSRQGRLTQPGTVLGTPYYMSPEQLRGRGLDGRADLYSVGVILYELLVGQLPFREDNLGDLMIAMTITGAPRLSERRPELGEELSAVIARTLAPTQEARYAGALELRDALLHVLLQLPEDAQCVVQLSPGESSPSDAQGRPLGQVSAVQPVSRAWAVSRHMRRPSPLSAALVVGIGLGLSALTWTLIQAPDPVLNPVSEPLGQATVPTQHPAPPGIRASEVPVQVDSSPRMPGSALPRAAVPLHGPVRVSVLDTVIVPERSAHVAPDAAATPAGKSQRARTPQAVPARAAVVERPSKVFTKLDF
jgi:serine/threonine-protein kinase